jgi:hypothetical protein
LQVDLTQEMPKCDATIGCTNADPLVFQKKPVFLVDLTVDGCYPSSKSLDPAFEVTPVNGKATFAFSANPLAGCPHTQMTFMIVSSVAKKGSGTPTPDFDSRNVDWRKQDLRHVCDGTNGFCTSDIVDHLACVADVGVKQVLNTTVTPHTLTAIGPLGQDYAVPANCF